MTMEYGTITGRLVAAVADTTDDPDVNPDIVPISGTVTFTPSVKAILVVSEDITVVPAPIVAALDANGYVSLNGVQGVTVLATNSTYYNPTGWTYRVSFDDLSANGRRVTFDPYNIEVPVGANVDLSFVTPITGSTGTAIVRGPKGDKGDTGDTGPVGPGGSDAGVSSYVADSNSATYSTLAKSFATKYASGSTKAATAPLLGKLKRGVQDATILAIGDSTGNETVEHFYLELVDLANRFPAYTVQYQLWDDAASAYGAAVTVQSGTGPQTLRFYNCSVAGKAPGYVQGSRWLAAVANIGAVDLTFISHGHNMGDPTPNTNGGIGVRWGYLSLTEELAVQHPGSGVVLMSQNPTYLSGRGTWQAQKAQILQNIAAQRGYGFIDVHQAFQDTGNPQAYVKGDLIHPTTSNDPGVPNGSRLWADVVGASLVYDAQAATLPRSRSSLLDAATSITSNVAFASWSGALPDGYTVTNGTVTKDTTNFETGTYGARLTVDSTSGSSFIQIDGGSTSFDRKNQLSGREVTVAVRLFVPASYTGTPSLVILDSGGSAQQARADVSTDTRDRYVWLIATKRVVSPGSSLKIQIAARLTGTDAGYITVDRLAVAEGNLPRDVVIGQAGPVGPAGTPSGQMDHLSTMGSNPALTMLAIGGSTIGPAAANQGIGKRIKPFRDMTIGFLDWVAGASSGNYDIGIYDATSGAKIWSKGGSAFPASSATQTETVSAPAVLSKDVEYWVVISADNITAKWRGVVGNNIAARKLVSGNDTFVANNMYPLPASLPGTTTPVAYFPVIVLREM